MAVSPATTEAHARDESDRLPGDLRVALAVSDAGNARQLTSFLGRYAEILGPEAIDADDGSTEAGGEAAVDVTLVDRAGLERYRDRIERARRASPMFPVLLIARDRDTRMIASAGAPVDDILRTPLQQGELQTRLANLVRLGRLVHEQRRRMDHAEEAYVGVERAYRAMTGTIEAMLDNESSAQLLAEVCRVIVQDCGYAHAWIGSLAPGADPAELELAGWDGRYRGYLDEIWPALTDKRYVDTLPFHQALGQGRPVVVHETTEAARLDPVKRAMQRWGFRSLAVIPVTVGTEPFGALCIYSEEPGAFQADEVGLLQRLASNLGYGLGAQRSERALAASRATLRRMAYYDTLTGLANREHLLERLDERLGEAPDDRFALLFIDLDGFKLANDAMGHAYGDDLLRRVANRLSKTVREGDLIARQGGDEFIVLMPFDPRDARGPDESAMDSCRRAIIAAAERLNAVMEKPFNVGGQDLRLSASIGLAFYPDHGANARQLLECADIAMYAAKSAGGNRTQVFGTDHAAQRKRRLSIETELGRALERGELVLHYQPIVSAATGETEGLEALVRWQRADGTMVSPGDFLPAAEDTGLIHPVGQFVLEQAFADLADWRARGHAVHVAVNLAVAQFDDPDIAQVIGSAAERAGVPKSAVILELTEEAMSNVRRDIATTLWALHDQGFRIAIDDFGAGYSSLGRLKDLPVDILKTDKSFVLESTASGASASIIEAVARMAAAIGATVTAEGVECEAHHRLVSELGCDCCQGFYFQRPAPVSEVLG